MLKLELMFRSSKVQWAGNGVYRRDGEQDHWWQITEPKEILALGATHGQAFAPDVEYLEREQLVTQVVMEVADIAVDYKGVGTYYLGEESPGDSEHVLRWWKCDGACDIEQAMFNEMPLVLITNVQTPAGDEHTYHIYNYTEEL